MNERCLHTVHTRMRGCRQTDLPCRATPSVSRVITPSRRIGQGFACSSVARGESSAASAACMHPLPTPEPHKSSTKSHTGGWSSPPPLASAGRPWPALTQAGNVTGGWRSPRPARGRGVPRRGSPPLPPWWASAGRPVPRRIPASAASQQRSSAFRRLTSFFCGHLGEAA